MESKTTCAVTNIYKLKNTYLFFVTTGFVVIIGTYVVLRTDLSTRYGMQPVNRETSLSVHRMQDVKISIGKGDMPHFVLGILTPHMNKELREAQRNSWIASILSMKDELPFKITYKFLIDLPTNETVKENNIYNDILYLNVTHQGRAVKFGEKVYVWFKYIYTHYPNALLGAKLDDDAFLCIPQLLHRLDGIKSGKLYYGWAHGTGERVSMKRRVDEMFVVLGRDLIARIANRTYFGEKICKLNDQLIDTNYGGTSIGHWLSIYNDIEFYPDNKRILQRGRGKNHEQFITQEFCTNKLIFHKTLPREMKELQKFNKLSCGSSTCSMNPLEGAVSGNMFSGEVERQLPNVSSLDEEVQPYVGVRNDTMNCYNWAVVTTIFKPSKAIFEIANASDWCLLVVADSKTPVKADYLQHFNNKRGTYLSIEEQVTFYPLLANSIPLNHFGRKNIGYIYAIHHGAKVIWDFDDDNVGIADVKDFLSHDTTSPYVTVCNDFENHVLNPYPYFETDESRTWPRGFPLQLIKDKTTIPIICELHENITLGIVQSLANMEPDVDAIYRLTREVPFDFKANRNTHKPLVLPIDVYAPFNAQATLWFSVAFDLMPLPISVNGRVSDIWRSYIAQHLMFKRNIRLAFSSPYVTQERNEHTLIRDFNAELDLYSKSKQLVDFIYFSSHEDIVDLYRDLYKREYIEAIDLQFIDAWQKTFNKVRGDRS